MFQVLTKQLSVKLLLVISIFLSFSIHMYSQENFSAVLSAEYKSPILIETSPVQYGVFYFGESVTIDLSGQVNICPFTTNERKGGIFGIGSNNVTIRHNNYKEAKNYPPSLYLVSGQERINLGQYYNQGKFIFKIDEKFTQSITKEFQLYGYIPGGENPSCELSTGVYQLDFSIKSEARIQLIEEYFTRMNNITVNELNNCLDRRIKKSNSRQLGEVMFKVIKNKNLPNALELYEYIKTYISPYVSGMNTILAESYLKNGDFRNANTEALNSIKHLVENKSDTYTWNIEYAKVNQLLGDSEYKKTHGILTSELFKAEAAYFEAANSYLKIGDKDNYTKMTLNRVNMLRRNNSIQSLEMAANILKKSIEEIQNKEILHKPKTTKILSEGTTWEIMKEDMIKNKIIYDELILENNTTIIFNKLLFDNKSYCEIIANRSAFGKNVKIIAIPPPSLDVPSTPISKPQGPKCTRFPAETGNPGKKGDDGANSIKLYLTLNYIANISSLEINLSGGNASSGGRGGRGGQAADAYCSCVTGSGGTGGTGGPGGNGGDGGNLTIRYTYSQNIDKFIKVINIGGKGGEPGAKGDGGPKGKDIICRSGTKEERTIDYMQGGAKGPDGIIGPKGFDGISGDIKLIKN